MRKLFVSLALITMALLGACDAGPANAALSSTGDAYADSAATAKGFAVGSLLSTKVVYVYFDPQCPHCGHLWNTFKPLNSKLKVVWIPVALLNGNSTSQGAALLAAAEPAKTMDEHEVKLANDRLGMIAPNATDSQRGVIKTNTQLLLSFGADSVPYVIAKNRAGSAVKQAGNMSETQLRTLLEVSE